MSPTSSKSSSKGKGLAEHVEGRASSSVTSGTVVSHKSQIQVTSPTGHSKDKGGAFTVASFDSLAWDPDLDDTSEDRKHFQRVNTHRTSLSDSNNNDQRFVLPKRKKSVIPDCALGEGDNGHFVEEAFEAESFPDHGSNHSGVAAAAAPMKGLRRRSSSNSSLVVKQIRRPANTATGQKAAVRGSMHDSCESIISIPDHVATHTISDHQRNSPVSKADTSNSGSAVHSHTASTYTGTTSEAYSNGQPIGPRSVQYGQAYSAHPQMRPVPIEADRSQSCHSMMNHPQAMGMYSPQPMGYPATPQQNGMNQMSMSQMPMPMYPNGMMMDPNQAAGAGGAGMQQQPMNPQMMMDAQLMMNQQMMNPQMMNPQMMNPMMNPMMMNPMMNPQMMDAQQAVDPRLLLPLMDPRLMDPRIISALGIDPKKLGVKSKKKKKKSSSGKSVSSSRSNSSKSSRRTTTSSKSGGKKKKKKKTDFISASKSAVDVREKERKKEAKAKLIASQSVAAPKEMKRRMKKQGSLEDDFHSFDPFAISSSSSVSNNPHRKLKLSKSASTKRIGMLEEDDDDYFDNADEFESAAPSVFGSGNAKKKKGLWRKMFQKSDDLDSFVGGKKSSDFDTRKADLKLKWGFGKKR